ncbi:MAG: hypothetical protein RLZZ191_1756, partial [Pseudomonadota bacterium]
MPIGGITVGHARKKIPDMAAALRFFAGKAVAPF